MQDDGKTLYCGNLSENVSEALLYELFLQAGPLEKVYIPRDRDGRQKNFGFITYAHQVSVPYAIALFKGTSLFNRTLTIQCRSQTASLPPPIRCNSLDINNDTFNPSNITQQFSQMTDSLHSHGLFVPFDGRDEMNQERFQDRVVNRNYERHTERNHDRLTMASLQGQWTHRHHPYMNDRHSVQGGRRDGSHHDHIHNSTTNTIETFERLANHIWESGLNEQRDPTDDFDSQHGNNNNSHNRRRGNHRRDRSDTQSRNWNRKDKNRNYGQKHCYHN